MTTIETIDWSAKAVELADEKCNLRLALIAIRDMADSRARINMPDGESLGSFCRRALSE